MAKKLSGLRLVFSSVLAIVFILAILFVPAGSFDWPSAWLFVVVFFVYAVLAGSWLRKNSPGLAGKRFSLNDEFCGSFKWLGLRFLNQMDRANVLVGIRNVNLS